jgi:neurotransmitter:Na+ symporter, NSS family
MQVSSTLSKETLSKDGQQAAGATSWSSRLPFLMASVGFAVGLGNIWRFPYITGENGGAAFVLVYLLCAFAIGIPILIAELMIGRRGKMSPPGAMREVAKQQGRSKHWQLVGGMNLLAAIVIMIVYCVISGWVLNYLFKAVMTGFVGVDGELAAQSFESLLGDSGTMLFWTLLGLALTGSIIYAGVQKGIERAVTILMPALFALMVLLVAYNVVVGGFAEAVDYLFSADFSKINTTIVFAAVGQAFFSIGVGMAGMMTYGAYLPKSVSIPRSVVIIIVADTLVALMAGLVIFPAVFNNGLDPAGGPGLIFKTLPVAFAQMPGGHIVSVLFFLLLCVAAITSMVGLIEPPTRWLEEYKGYARHKSAMVILGGIAVFSVLSIFGYNILSDYTFAGKNINGVLDYFSNQILLPIGGLLIAIFAGWFVNRSVSLDELGLGDGLLFKGWYFLIRFLVPIAVFLVFVLGISN